MASGGRQYDIVVFGASSFTGQFIVEELARVAGEERIKWAIAGRNMEKLQEVLKKATDNLAKDYNNIPIVIADALNEESLNVMCKQTKLVLNVCGPFAHLGENVVRACIENKTHYVDVSGEVIFLENMQLKYNSMAKENKVYVVGSCGFRCLPVEMGVMFTSQKFDGDLNSLEAYLSTSGPVKYNTSTFESQVYGFQTRHELKPLRKALFSSVEYYKPQHVVKAKSGLFYDKNSSKYCSSWPDAYKSVLYRSQRFLYENNQIRPIQCALYVCHDSLLIIIIFLITGFIMNFLANFSWGRALLLKYPGFFSGGLAQSGGPTESQINNSAFSVNFYGKGYPSRTKESEPHEDQPDKAITTRVLGPDPGYLTTAICVVQAALVVLKENEKIPDQGGVLSPAAAFRNTGLVNRLTKRNLKFEIVDGEKAEDTTAPDCPSIEKTTAGATSLKSKTSVTPKYKLDITG
ncbi:unnamed protein product [Acanthosepion pharaonis]|uniref:Saccharopine dehydrogenase NADP binding domain-containing protein n=1 Tax=Acanthosepion pharaonis TaxID=158019 RepID=A0A812BYT7_ACAPH|nr:unnamed protein product [Sepia pharaonis]